MKKHYIIYWQQFLMELRMQRQLAYLSEQDFKKLFPTEYFSKYAEHLNILRFEDTVFLEPAKPKEKKFTHRHKRADSEGDLRKGAKVKLNRYDAVGDTIAKNKIEATRMEKLVRGLNEKLKQGPSKTVMNIRTPLEGYGEVPSEVFDKMRLIENEQYSAEMQLQREKQKAQYQFVHFKMRNRSTSPSKFSLGRSRSILADSVESRSIRDRDEVLMGSNLTNTMQLHPLHPSDSSSAIVPSQSLNYHQRLQRLMVQARSDVVALNPQSRNADVKYIMTLNRSIRKINTLKDQMRNQRRKQTLAEWKTQGTKMQMQPERQEQRKRKNLIAMTDGIRKEGEQIEVLSRYRDLLREREFKEFMMQKEGSNKTMPSNQTQ